MAQTSGIFEKSVLEVLERLADDYGLEAVGLRAEAYALVLELRDKKDADIVDAAVVARLFTLYRRAMNYLIDRRQKFWHYLQRPEDSTTRRRSS